MASCFRVKNHPSIVRASNVVLSEGLVPRRVVLRKNAEGDAFNAYVTHIEGLDITVDESGQFPHLVAEHMHFSTGHYFDFGPGSKITADEAYREALADFESRCATV